MAEEITGENAVASEPETKENKAIKAEKKEKKGVFSSEVPVYLVAMVLVFGIVLGFAVNEAIYPQQQPPTQECPEPIDTYEKVLLKILYSSDCEFCDDISLRNVFDVRGVDYTLEKVDIKGREEEFKEKYGLEFVPVALVEVESLEANPNYKETAVLIRANFEEKDGFYVVPENFLDQLPHPLMFLEPVEEFEAEQGKVKVEQFCDFLSEACYNSLETVNGLREEFGEEMDYGYRHFLLADKSSEPIAMGAECARDQNVFDEFTELIFRKAFVDKINTTVDYVIKTTGIEAGVKDIWQFEGSCIDQLQKKDLLEEESKAAEAFNLEFVPSYVVDSKYVVVKTEKLRERICELHPELSPCN